MRVLAVLLALILSSGISFAQDRKKQNMSRENRDRMREDMREVNRGGRPERQRQMTPQEREKLRQDIREANKNLKR
jgi:hypothetical protein